MCTQVKERICRLIQAGVESGARLLLDGRNIEVCTTTYLCVIILLDFFWSYQSFKTLEVFLGDVVDKILCLFSYLNHYKFKIKEKNLM